MHSMISLSTREARGIHHLGRKTAKKNGTRKCAKNSKAARKVRYKSKCDHPIILQLKAGFHASTTDFAETTAVRAMGTTANAAEICHQELLHPVTAPSDRERGLLGPGASYFVSSLAVPQKKHISLVEASRWLTEREPPRPHPGNELRGFF